MKIFFLWDWNSVDQYTIGWQDGLAAALKELIHRGHHILVVTCGETQHVIEHPYFPITVTKYPDVLCSEFAPDVVLMWGDMTRPNANPILKLGIPMAICFAGGNLFGDNVDYFDHIFVESEVYKETYLEHGHENVSVAFGTNTDLFKPMPEQVKQFDTIFPATFASWKRHELYSAATRGLRSLAVGHIQPNGIDESSWQTCLINGTTVLPHITADGLRYLYAASRICVVTSSSAGGSQRTVLEAMAMNIPLVITESDKFDFAKGLAYEAEPSIESVRGRIDALLDGEHDTNTREYILNNWSHIQYADALEKGLQKICAAEFAE